MPVAANSTSDLPQHCAALPAVQDPVLVVVYFFSGVADRAAVTARLEGVCGKLVQELHLDEPFTPDMLRSDLRSLKFVRYQWNPESRATLAQFYFEPSEIYCLQLVLPLGQDSAPAGQALDGWQQIRVQLEGWMGDLLKPEQGTDSKQPAIYWGSSRLYWAILDKNARSPEQYRSLALELQKRACSQPPQEGHRTDSAAFAPVHARPYRPQSHKDEYGTLWRLDEPAAKSIYEAVWLLVSPPQQNDPVSLNYILNCRFAIGEAFMCKAYNQAKEYALLERNLKESIQIVQTEIRTLLEEGASDFDPERADQIQRDLFERQKRIQRVARVYSILLDHLSVIDRLHLTVKTNLDNYAQMASEFKWWNHPSSQFEVARLKSLLKQIEHDQQSRRAALSFQTAIETVRASLDLTRNQLSAALLKLEQNEAREAERWNVVIAVLGIILSVSQVVVLSFEQFSLWWKISLLFVVIVLLWLSRRTWARLWRQRRGKK